MNDGRGVVICNAQAIIQMTNQAVHNIFGHSKTELRGKNVSMLMPPQLAANHTSYGEHLVADALTDVPMLHVDPVAASFMCMMVDKCFHALRVLQCATSSQLGRPRSLD